MIFVYELIAASVNHRRAPTGRRCPSVRVAVAIGRNRDVNYIIQASKHATPQVRSAHENTSGVDDTGRVLWTAD